MTLESRATVAPRTMAGTATARARPADRTTTSQSMRSFTSPAVIPRSGGESVVGQEPGVDPLLVEGRPVLGHVGVGLGPGPAQLRSHQGGDVGRGRGRPVPVEDAGPQAAVEHVPEGTGHLVADGMHHLRPQVGQAVDQRFAERAVGRHQAPDQARLGAVAGGGRRPTGADRPAAAGAPRRRKLAVRLRAPAPSTPATWSTVSAAILR